MSAATAEPWEDESIPESNQTMIESTEEESAPGWMLARDEEVRKLTTEQIFMQDKDWHYTDTNADDTVQIKMLQERGYTLAPNHPLNNEKTRTMVYRLPRDRYDLGYKAETSALDLRSDEVLRQAGGHDSVDPAFSRATNREYSEPKTNRMSMSDATDRMKATDDDFDKQGKEYDELFEKQLAEQ